MSTHNDYAGIVPLKPGTAREVVSGAIAFAIGAEDADLFFPVAEVVCLSENGLEVTGIDFEMIPSQGAHAEMIEAAMLALAPFVEGTHEIEMVSGMNWADASMYRFIDGRVEVSGARLMSDGNWMPVESKPERFAVKRC